MITKNLITKGNIGGTAELYNNPVLCSAMLSETAHINENITKHLLDYNNKYWKTPKSVLELACGTGTMTKAASKLGIPSTGIDFSKDLIDTANKKSNGLDKYELSNIDNFKLSDKFDLCFISWCTLAYLTKNSFISHLSCVYEHLENEGTYYMSLGSYLDATPSSIPSKLQYDKVHLYVNGKFENYFVGEYTSNFCKKTKKRNVVFFAVSEDGKAVSAKQELQTYTTKDLLDICRYSGFKKIKPISILNEDWDDPNADLKFKITTYERADIFALVK